MPKTTDILKGANQHGVLEDSIATRIMKNKTVDILRGANRYGVLEDSDEECTKIGTKCMTWKNVKINLEF